ncbi:MAG: hypothetical protein WC350_05925, partial [Candidatus Micrarchaeia archaeon]
MAKDKIIYVLLFLGALWVLGGMPGLPQSVAPAEEGTPGGAGYNPTSFDTATFTHTGYTGSWGEAGAKTAVGATFTSVNAEGTALVNDAADNTTDTTVGETIDVYCTGASYYCDPLLDYAITNRAPSRDIEVYSVAAKTNMEIIVYDNTETTALTADDDANNPADYAGGSLG